jgi:hypothetical protein
MTLAAAAEFYKRASRLQVDTLENRNKILMQMVAEGLVSGMTETNKSPAEYLEHVKKNFNVLDLTAIKPSGKSDSVWCTDSKTGERVLLDRRTNEVIMREGDK